MLLRNLLCFFSLTAASIAADWPEFLGPTRDNHSPENNIAATLPAEGWPVVWERRTGTGYGAPSVFGDTLVLHHREGNTEYVEAIGAATGVTRWRFGTESDFQDPFGYNNGPRCQPILRDNRCYTLGAAGALLCRDLTSGDLLWRRGLLKEFNVPEAFFGVGASPLLVGDRLFVIVGGQPNSGVVAFEAETGKTLWENVGEKTWTGEPMRGWPGDRTVQWNLGNPAFQKQADYCTPVLATFHGQPHLLCMMRQGLVSLDPATGEERFSYWFRARQDSSVNAMTPVVSGDTILLSSAYFRQGAVLLRVAEGGQAVTEVWRGQQLEMHWSRPVLVDGWLYGFSGRNEPDGVFRCVEMATGKVGWERPEGWPNAGHMKLDESEPMPNVFGRGSVIAVDGKLIALGEAGLLGLFQPDPRQVRELGRWQVPKLRYPCWAGPVLAEGRLFLRSEDWLVCLDSKARP